MLRQLYQNNLQSPQSIRMGLDNTRRLYELLGKPLKNTPIIHVTGSKGKGSVCFKIAETLRLNGIRSGLFVSPHISCYRERIQVNARLLEIETMNSILPQILAVCERENIKASFFELTTIMALIAFERAGCEAVVLEVGLGGRLDSTNIIPNPILSVITSIQLEHQHILGRTHKEIAWAKAGIIKAGCPVLLGFGTAQTLQEPTPSSTIDASVFEHFLTDTTDESPDVVRVFYDEAQIVQARKVSHTRDVLKNRRYRHGETDDIDVLNGDIAAAALQLIAQDTSAIPGSEAFQLNVASLRERLNGTDVDLSLPYSVRPACRFQQVPVGNGASAITVILDVAHTHDAIAALCQKVNSLQATEIHVVFGMCSDKNVRRCIEHFLNLVGPGRHATHIHCISAEQKRLLSAGALQQLVEEVAQTHGLSEPSETAQTTSDDLLLREAHAQQTLRRVIELATDAAKRRSGFPMGQSSPRPVIVVCGSAYVMGSAREVLGLPEPRDPPIAA